ncbi:pilus assembly protein N-terminal domain-containing protein [Chthonobacter albigriseus]|uniref:pilus assembly protein N-terminal domain-containing protein n=1 Tax=Chthonobacter albigriseus TaxID=1683161 RepID=UPI0015EF1FDC|nr:pilus assembly protein N-terminal domain-containing protein [Chthonobacter albigriseus]
MATRYQIFLMVGVLTALPFSAGAQSTGLEKESVTIVMDQAKIMRIAAPASTIIIGNPAIADATMQDAQTLVITGRTYGTTNMIILDSEGETIADANLVVEGPTENRVTVYRATNRFSYSCASSCEASVVPGDAADFFGNIQSQAGARSGAASGQATQAQ